MSWGGYLLSKESFWKNIQRHAVQMQNKVIEQPRDGKREDRREYSRPGMLGD